MSQEQDKKLYDTLTRTGEFLKSVTPVEGEEYSLDAILAEFGRGGAKPARETPEAQEPPEKKTAAPPAVPEEELRETRGGRRLAPKEKSESPAPKERWEHPQPPAECAGTDGDGSSADPVQKAPPRAERQDVTPPDRVSLKNLMADTVDAVLAENDDAILEPRRSLSDRLRGVIPHRREKTAAYQDTEELWSQAEPEPEPEEEPEPDPEDAYRAQRRQSRHLRRGVTLLAVPMVLSIAMSILSFLHILPEVLQRTDMVLGAVWGGLTALSLVLAMDLWRCAADHIRRRRGCRELGVLLSGMVTLSYCVFGMFFGFDAGEPFVAVVCTGLWLCQLGLYLESESRHTAYALINMGGAVPYTVSAVEVGVCKQKGTLRGFYHASEKPDLSRLVQNYAVPLQLSAATVLSGVVCLTGHSGDRFLWIWSAMLAAVLPLSLALTGTLPLYCLQKRLRAGGSAIAGWWGAKGIQGKRRLVLAEGDLFPPGTVEFNGYKVFGEERGKMIAYAAGMTASAKSQLKDLFAQQLAAEGGFRYTAEDLQFYEDGGISGTIRGETVLMGSAYFMRHHGVSLPHDLKLQTGVFLSVDGVLGAIFVIKYQPSRNVEWALRAMLRARLRPVLAVRSGNVTPGLLKRKFRFDVRPVYPDVVTRVALSDAMENVGEKANAVLYREGLMPLAETVIGALRLRRVARVTLVLSYVGALAGLLLSYYFTHAAAYSALEPLYMLGFLLLWLLPTVLLSGTVKRF